MTESMIEKLARATCQAKGQNPDMCTMGSGWAGPDGSGSVCHRYAWQDFVGAARAVLLALREPDEGMVKAVRDQMDPGFCDEPGDPTPPDEVWRQMIDHILNESGKPADPI